MNSIILAAMLTLTGGYNNAGVSGEVVAIEAATSNATATVEVRSVSSYTVYTNATAEVVTYEDAYHVQLPYTVDAVAATNEYFEFGMDGAKYVWTLKKAITFYANLTDVGNNQFAQTNGNCVFAAVNPQGEPIKSGRITSRIATIAPPDSATIDLYSVPLAQVIDGIDGELYWGMLQGSNLVEEIVLPAGTTITSSTTYNPETGITQTRVASFEYTYPTTTNVVGAIDWDAFTDTNGVSRIIGEPQRFDMPFTNTVVTAQVAAETYTATNTIATVTTSDHFGTTVTNAFLFGGGIYVGGAEDGDIIRLIYK